MGCNDGCLLGSEVGGYVNPDRNVGLDDSPLRRARVVGREVGWLVGRRDGFLLGCADGREDGRLIGCLEGWREG